MSFASSRWWLHTLRAAGQIDENLISLFVLLLGVHQRSQLPLQPPFPLTRLCFRYFRGGSTGHSGAGTAAGCRSLESASSALLGVGESSRCLRAGALRRRWLWARPRASCRCRRGNLRSWSALLLPHGMGFWATGGGVRARRGGARAPAVSTRRSGLLIVIRVGVALLTRRRSVLVVIVRLVALGDLAAFDCRLPLLLCILIE